VAPLITSLLEKGVSVVLDFPRNTRTQRAWFRTLFDSANAAHELHFIDAADDLRKRQLKERSKHLPPATPWTTDAQFDAIAVHFDPPSGDEGFNVIRHSRD
jgi:predicted kinase